MGRRRRPMRRPRSCRSHHAAEASRDMSHDWPMRTDLDATLDDLERRALRGQAPDREQALAVLASSDDDLLDVVAAGGRVRRHFFANRVKLNLIVNMKSGLCPEDCSYCSQRRGSDADVLKYNWVVPAEAAETADRAIAGGAKRFCLVASGR